MGIEVKVFGENAKHAAAEYRNFYDFMQSTVTMPKPGDQAQLPAGADEFAKAAQQQVVEKPAPAEKAAGKKAAAKTAKPAKEETAEEDTDAKKWTLNEVAEVVAKIAGDQKDAAVMEGLKDLAKRYGVARLSMVPPEKFGDLMADMQEAFPAAFDDEAAGEAKSFF